MKTSTDLEQITEALLEFQHEMPVVPKERTGKVEGVGGRGNAYSYEYLYADLNDAVELAKPKLYTHQLVVVQAPGYKKGKDTLTTRLLHVSGQWMQDTMRLYIPKETPQVQGSSITYAKRYAFCAMLMILADHDDDGQIASAAWGEDAGAKVASRRKRPAAGATAVGAKAGAVRGRDEATEGELGLTGKDRNLIVAHYGRNVDPPIIGDAVVAEVNKILKLTGANKLDSLVKMTAQQGAIVFGELGINP